MSDWSIKLEDGVAKIYCSDILHLLFKYRDLTGLQAWVAGDKTKNFCIEYSFKGGGKLFTEYNTKTKWIQILQLLDSASFFAHPMNY